MKIKEKDCPEFKELKNFVGNGDYDEIDNWFKKYQISKKPRVEKDLTLRILNESYFFSFACTPFITNRQEVLDETTKREVAILRNLKCENQLKLFSVASIDDVNYKHFEVIKLTKKNKELLKHSNSVCHVITKLFNDEKFSEIDKIESILKFSVLEQNCNYVAFHHREKNSRGVNFFKIDETIFASKYDIVFNYTETKKQYLDEKGISLPTVDEATYLHHKMLKAVNENQGYWRSEDIERVNQAVKSYKIQKSYLDLNSDLENTNKISKKIKI
jgi:hypothetical protein